MAVVALRVVLMKFQVAEGRMSHGSSLTNLIGVKCGNESEELWSCF